MSEADYYPAGAYSDPNAPFNQSDPDDKEFEVTCTQTLSKTVTVVTNNYIPGASGVDYEPDDEGGCCAVPWEDDPDTTDTNWADEYAENDYHTPAQLIGLFKRYLQNKLDGTPVPDSPSYLKHLIEECDEWAEIETEFVED